MEGSRRSPPRTRAAQRADRPNDSTLSIERAAKVLSVLAEAQGEMRVVDIAARLAISKGSIHRVLRALVSTGLAAYVEPRRTYQLGGRSLQLGLAVLERLPLRKEIRPALQELRDATQETSAFYIRAGDRILCVQRAITHLRPRSIYPELGFPYKIHPSAAGRVLLAYERDAVADRYMAEVLEPSEGSAAVAELRLRLEAIRACGYEVELKAPRFGTNHVSLPLFNAGRALLGTVSVLGPEQRFTEKTIRRSLPLIRDIVEDMSTRLASAKPYYLG